MENTICVACGSICSKEVRAKNWGYVGKIDQVYTYMLCNCCDSLNRKKRI